MFSILYVAEANIFRFGLATDTEEKAIQLAKDGQASGVFDIDDQHVFILLPDHRLVELVGSDLDT